MRELDGARDVERTARYLEGEELLVLGFMRKSRFSSNRKEV